MLRNAFGTPYAGAIQPLKSTDRSEIADGRAVIGRYPLFSCSASGGPRRPGQRAVTSRRHGLTARRHGNPQSRAAHRGRPRDAGTRSSGSSSNSGGGGGGSCVEMKSSDRSLPLLQTASAAASRQRAVVLRSSALVRRPPTSSTFANSSRQVGVAGDRRYCDDAAARK